MSHFYPATPNSSTSDVENAQEHFLQQQKFDLFIFVHLLGDGVFFTAGTFHSIELLGSILAAEHQKKSTSLPSFETGENPLLDDDSKSTSTTRTSGHDSWKKLLLSMIHGASGIKCVKAMIDKTKATSVNEFSCFHCLQSLRTHANSLLGCLNSS